MSINLSINLKRPSKIYYEGESVTGVVVVEAGGTELRHEGLMLSMEGTVSLQLSTRNAGLLDAFSTNIKEITRTRIFPVVPQLLTDAVKSYFPDTKSQKEDDPMSLVSTTLEAAAAGRLPAGRTEIPFELPLRARGAAPLPETYHGVFVNIMYALKATLKRSFLNKPLNASCQFFVQHRPQEAPAQKPVRCEITPATIRAAGGAGGAGGGAGGAGRGALPNFQIYAEIDSTVCALDKPITGMIRVDECSVPIKSIELQLVRAETCGNADAHSRDATEIQNIQVCEGGPRARRAVPLYMVLPRLFTCPTTAAHCYKIEFELNIAVIFEDDYLVTENFPILLLRCR